VRALHVALAADLEPATLTRLAVRASGSLDDVRGLSAAHLYVDGNGNGRVDAAEPRLATTTFAADDGAATFTLAESHRHRRAARAAGGGWIWRPRRWVARRYAWRWRPPTCW
jgi:hypothetical protein